MALNESLVIFDYTDTALKAQSLNQDSLRQVHWLSETVLDTNCHATNFSG